MVLDSKVIARELVREKAAKGSAALSLIVRGLNAETIRRKYPGASSDLSDAILDEVLLELTERKFRRLPELLAQLSITLEEPLSATVRYFHLQSLRADFSGTFQLRATDKACQIIDATNDAVEAYRAVQTVEAIGLLDCRALNSLRDFLVRHLLNRRFYSATSLALECLTSVHGLRHSQAVRYYKTLKSFHSHLNGHLGRTAGYLGLVGEFEALQSSFDFQPKTWGTLVGIFQLAKENGDLATKALDWYLSRSEAKPDEFESSIVNIFDDGKLVLWLFERALKSDLSGDRGALSSSPLHLLLDCNLPFQLEAFRSIKLKAEDLEKLHKKCVKERGHEANFATIEDHDQEIAWNLALRLGLLESKDWIMESLRQQPTAYMAFELCKITSIIGVEGISEIYRVHGNDGKFVSQTCDHLAIRSDEEFFRSLLKAEGRGPKPGEYPVTQYANALATASYITGRHDLLIDSIEGNSETWRRSACSYAFRRSARNLLGSDLWSRVRTIVLESDLDPFPWCELILASAEHESLIKSRSLTTSLRGNSLYQRMNLTLARVLNRQLHEPNEIANEIAGYMEEAPNDSNEMKIAAIILAVAYRNNSLTGREVAKILRLPGISHSQFIFSTPHAKSNREVGCVLWEEALKRNGRSSSYSALLEGGMRFDPSRLNKRLLKRAAKWSSNAQIGLINAIDKHRKLQIEASISDVMEICLLRDRKSQWHGLFIAAHMSKAHMRNLVLEWLVKDIHYVRAALEGGFWLDEATWDRCFLVASRHQEPSLREYAQSLLAERVAGANAKKYLAMILSSSDFLRDYSYIQAVKSFGDEAVLRQIGKVKGKDFVLLEILNELAESIDKRVTSKRAKQFRESRFSAEYKSS